MSGIGGLIEQNTPFFAVKTLITRLLELDSCKNLHDREQLVLQHMSDEKMKQLLPLLNDLLVLKVNSRGYIFCVIKTNVLCLQFPQTNLTMHMTHDERMKGLHTLLFQIVHQVYIH